METLGIDLASFNGTTGMCRVSWRGAEGVVVHQPTLPATDDLILHEARAVLSDRGGHIGIDAPFGFPRAFSRAVANWSDHRAVGPAQPHPVEDCCKICRAGWNPVTRRVTDVAVHRRLRRPQVAVKGKNSWPLSSVVERITPSVLRCAGLLAQLSSGSVDRTGTDRIVEVYPAAALPTFGLARPNYKNKKGRPERAALVSVIEAQLGCKLPESNLWLDGDDALDALLAALVARAAALGLTVTPLAGGETEAAREEGWIHLPADGVSLAQLAADPR